MLCLLVWLFYYFFFVGVVAKRPALLLLIALVLCRLVSFLAAAAAAAAAADAAAASRQVGLLCWCGAPQQMGVDHALSFIFYDASHPFLHTVGSLYILYDVARIENRSIEGVVWSPVLSQCVK